MFQDDMNGKDESGVYEIKYGDHMFFVPKRMDDGVEAIMAIERICCRGFSFKRKRKKLIGFMRDIWAFAIDEDRREVAGRIEREFAGLTEDWRNGNYRLHLLRPVFLYAAGSFCGFAVVFWRKYDILNVSLTTFHL